VLACYDVAAVNEEGIRKQMAQAAAKASRTHRRQRTRVLKK